MQMMTLGIAGIVTWLLRASLIVGPGSKASLPGSVDRLIAQLRPAILGALVASAFMARAAGDVTAIPMSWLLAAVTTSLAARVWSSLAVGAAAGLGVVAMASFLGIPV